MIIMMMMIDDDDDDTIAADGDVNDDNYDGDNVAIKITMMLMQ